jgi:hypothetical protein
MLFVETECPLAVTAIVEIGVQLQWSRFSFLNPYYANACRNRPVARRAVGDKAGAGEDLAKARTDASEVG